jgi:hypothetical protein
MPPLQTLDLELRVHALDIEGKMAGCEAFPTGLSGIITSLLHIVPCVKYSTFTNSNNYVAVLERKGIRMRDIATDRESTSCVLSRFEPRKIEKGDERALS